MPREKCAAVVRIALSLSEAAVQRHLEVGPAGTVPPQAGRMHAASNGAMATLAHSPTHARDASNGMTLPLTDGSTRLRDE
jgi:hypothetical protein